MPVASPTLHWGQLTVTVTQGETATVTSTATNPSAMTYSVGDTSIATATPNSTWTSWDIQGMAPGTTTVTISGAENAPDPLTITVASAEDESYLNKRGVAHFWENIDNIKQDKLTAGTGISITGNTISATGGGEAGSVAWGHITGAMSSQTDLTTALNAKANTADLAAVATSGDYDDLTDKPTIGDATLTIQRNGTNVQTFTANQSTNATANITVPTKTSDLTNDSGFITSETEEIFYIGITSIDDVNGTFTADKTFEEILAAINAGQLPVVYDRMAETGFEQVDYVPLMYYYIDDESSEDYISFVRSYVNTVGGYTTAAGLEGGILTFDFQRDRSGGTPVYNYYYGNRSSAISSLSSVSSTSTNAQVPGAKLFYDTMATKADISSLATVATSGSYNDLSNKPTIPTVNNATLTIQKNGTTVATFTANSSTATTANITVPTVDSALSSTSENPVQNKVIYSAIGDVESILATLNNGGGAS